MSNRNVLRSVAPSPTRPRLNLFGIGPEGRNSTRWLINGHRATLFVWTSEEWERLPDRPPDAQFAPSGIWCALRMAQ